MRNNDILNMVRGEAIERRERVANKAYKFYADEYVEMEEKFIEFGGVMNWTNGILESDFYDLRYEPDELKILIDEWREFLNDKLLDQGIDIEL